MYQREWGRVLKRVVRERAVLAWASAATSLASAVWGRSVVAEALELVLRFDRTPSGAAACELEIDCDQQRRPEERNILLSVSLKASLSPCARASPSSSTR